MMLLPTIQNSKISNVKFGEYCKIIEPSNLYGCEIKNNVFVGPFVEIQKNVIIGNNTRIQSHSFICENVIIGDDCFISHGVMFINDDFKNGKISREPEDWKHTNIGNNVLIGSNSTILPVKICENVVIGAGSVVTKNITDSGVYVGNPAKKLRNL